MDGHHRRLHHQVYGVTTPDGIGGTDPSSTAECGVIEIVWVDKNNNAILEPLPPELMGMDKVAWDGTREMLPEEITTTEDWYNYVAQTGSADGITSRWENAKNSDGSYFVWVPRYAYKIIYFDTDANRIAYLNDNTSTAGIIAYYTKDGKINSTENKVIVAADSGIQSPKTKGYTDYIVHPSFETNVDLGGWDSDLSGMWVAKYEMSIEGSRDMGTTWEEWWQPGNVATKNAGSSSYIRTVSKPGVESWRGINIANSYNNSFAYDREKESHLIKNSEWGAIAYLAHSRHGRNGTKVSINSVSIGTGGVYGSLNTIYGTNSNQSTTGNAHGIYDLNGHNDEYVAAYNKAYSQTGNCFGGAGGNTDVNYKPATGSHFAYSKYPNSDKYATVYENNSTKGDPTNNAINILEFKDGRTGSITGDGILETFLRKDLNWFLVGNMFTTSISPFFIRGRLLWRRK